jgi:hypothetical protein
MAISLLDSTYVQPLRNCSSKIRDALSTIGIVYIDCFVYFTITQAPTNLQHGSMYSLVGVAWFSLLFALVCISILNMFMKFSLN